MSRQQRRAEERAKAKAESRRATFDRVHGEILAGRTALDMWRTYSRNRFPPVLEPEHLELLKETFYAGLASMMELMNRVSPDEITEDQGVEMLQRLYEELDTYAKGKR